MALTHPLSGIPLRSSLAADAMVCATTGLMTIVFAAPLADLTDLPANLLRVAGLLLMPYVAFLAALVRRTSIPERAASVAIGVNIAWAVGCGAVLLSDRVQPNGVGVAFILVQAGGVLVIAAIQRAGMR
jgi:hypothetical protein